MSMERVYNAKRLHSALGNGNPEEFETLFAQKVAQFEWPAVVRFAEFTPNPGHFSVEINRPTNQQNKRLKYICSISCRSERTENRIWIRLARINRSGAIGGRSKLV